MLGQNVGHSSLRIDAASICPVGVMSDIMPDGVTESRAEGLYVVRHRLRLDRDVLR